MAQSRHPLTTAARSPPDPVIRSSATERVTHSVRHQSFRTRSRPSTLAVFVGLIATALQAVSAIFQTAPLTILHAGEISAAFSAEQLQALAYLFLGIGGQTFNMYLVFFGFGVC